MRALVAAASLWTCAAVLHAQGARPASDPAEAAHRQRQMVCDALLAAGPEALLGGEVEKRSANYEAPLPGVPCEFDRRDDHGISVVAMVSREATTAAARALFDEEVKKADKDAAKGLQDESSLLGVPAFSLTAPGRFSLLALKGELIVWLEITAPAGDGRKCRRFAKDVLAKL